MEVQKRQTQTKEILKTALIQLLQEKDFEAQLFVALSEESGLSYQEMKELILPAQPSNQGVNHV